ncbi:MAG TPA: pitrilysin family protein [Planctomycetota bacterium]|nr:pitrilysin family protein [Planctomycetota bacterium]
MPRRFSLHQFDNGLTLCMEHMPQAISSAVGFVVRTGARNEEAKLDGVSHFLEHMMFKGTHKRGWLEINRDFDLMGARYNAFTSWEETCYYAWVLNEEVPRALELLSDMLAPTLPPEEFNTEKKVILEEIAQYEDMPQQVVFEEAMRVAFSGHRLSSNIIGSPKTVKRMTRDEMLAYFQRRYTPANIVLFACGNIDEPRLIADVERLWAGRGGPAAPTDVTTPAFHPGRRILQKKDVARQHVILLWPSLGMSDRRSVAASILGAIYGDEKNSRLYWALRHTGLAEEASGGYFGFSDTGVIAAQAACDPDKAQKVSGILQQEARRLRKGIQKTELERARNRARTAVVLSAETPFERFRQLMQEYLARREFLTTDEMLARIASVSLKDLYALLEEFPLDKRCVLTSLGPKR